MFSHTTIVLLEERVIDLFLVRYFEIFLLIEKAGLGLLKLDF